MAIFNTVYGGEWPRKPNANTLCYFPFVDNATDQMWKATLSNSWTQDTLWYYFTANTNINWLDSYTVKWICSWTKLNSTSWSSWNRDRWIYYDKCSMWWYISSPWKQNRIWTFYTSSYTEANVQITANTSEWNLLWVWYDGTNTVYAINWEYWILRAWSWYNFWNTFCLNQMVSWSWSVSHSNFIAESSCRDETTYLKWYNKTKATYWK